MWTFIIAGAVYLVGVAAILVLRPAMMFTPDGNWKEFGIGKSEDRYTPFPFWLFCLVWALAAYALVLLIPGLGSRVQKNNGNVRNVRNVAEEVSRIPELDLDEVDVQQNTTALPKGYYVLNKKATKLSGVPKYIYLGQED